MMERVNRWKHLPLIEVATLQRGYDLPVQDRTPGPYPIFAANGSVGTHSVGKVTGPGVVTGRSGTIGQVHYAETDYWPLNTSLFVTDFHGNHPRFVYYLLRHLRLERFHEGTGVPTLNRNNVHKLEVSVPPLVEQRRIAEILDKADAIRQKRREALVTAKHFIHGLFWNLFGRGILDCAVGKPPASWRSVTIDGIKDPTPYSCVGGPFGSDLGVDDYVNRPGVPVIRGTNLSDDSPHMNEDGFVFVSEAKAEELSRCSAYRGDIIFSQRGARLAGQLGLIREDSRFPRYIVSQSQMRLKVDPAQTDPIFVIHYCQSLWAVHEMERRTISTGVPHINLGILKAFPIHLPPRDQQHAFVRAFERHSSLCGSYGNAASQSDSLFHSLVQRAFRGEL